jgi:hypothetical protein
LVVDVLPKYRENRAEWRLWLWSGLLASSIGRLVPDPFSEVLMVSSFLLIVLAVGKKLRDPVP